jgi:hypothetical protein
MVKEDEVLRFIPSDHNVLVGVNWQKVKASPLAEKIMKDVPDNMKPLLEEIHGVTIGMKINEMNEEGRKFIGVTAGKTQPAKVIDEIKRLAEEKGTKLNLEEYEGNKIYSSALDGDFVLAVVGNQILFGSKEKVQNGMDIFNHKGDSVLKNEKLMNLSKGVDQTKMLWALALLPEKTDSDTETMPTPQGLSAVRAIDFTLDFDKVFFADLGVLTKTKEDAQQMTAMATSYKTLFGSSVGKQNPAIGKLLESLKIKNTEARVEISLQIDQETLEMISKKVQEKSMVGSKLAPGTTSTHP